MSYLLLPLDVYLRLSLYALVSFAGNDRVSPPNREHKRAAVAVTHAAMAVITWWGQN